MNPKANPATAASPPPPGGEDLARNLSQYEGHWSSRFRKKWNYSSQGKIRRFRQLMRRHGLLDRPGLAVFDQGFGLGLMLFSFHRSCRLAGLELAQSAVDAVRAEARALGFADTDLRRFEPGQPLPDEWREAFDVLISSHVLEHISDAESALRDLVTLLRPGGTACLMVPINETPGEDLNHFYFFTPSGFVDLIRRSGLEPVETREGDRLWAVVCPLAYALQRRSSPWLRLSSIVVNAVTGILPLPVLNLLDVMLKPFGFRNRQLFVICRKPAGGVAGTAPQP